jgi:hypothetical protein
MRGTIHAENIPELNDESRNAVRSVNPIKWNRPLFLKALERIFSDDLNIPEIRICFPEQQHIQHAINPESSAIEITADMNRITSRINAVTGSSRN